jgi:hypothetical protein
MKRIDIELNLDMLKLLVEGDTIGLALQHLGIVVVLHCEESVAKDFRDKVNSALLHLLPGPTEIH